MNANRRKRIQKVIDQLGEIDCEITAIADEESDAHDNLPESLQYSDGGEAMNDAYESLSEASEWIEDLISTLGDAAK